MTLPREDTARPEPFFRHLDRPTQGSDGIALPPPGGRSPAPVTGVARASSVLGVISLIASAAVVTLPLGVLALLLALVDVWRARRRRLAPSRPAMIGLVTAALGVVIAGAVLAYLVTRPGFADYWHCLRSADTSGRMQQCLTTFRDSVGG